jgi:hemerythrin-like metal-binding protein
MPFISWQTDYQIGVAEIDEQHQRLVEMVNSLHEAMKSGSGKSLVPKVLNELVEYTVTHFNTEERLMQETRYPHYLQHKRQHDELTQQVVQMKSVIDSGKPVNTIEIVNFLKGWLINHILGSDKQFGEHILRQQKAA